MNRNDIELLLQDLENMPEDYWRRNISGALLIRMGRALLRVFALIEQWETDSSNFPNYYRIEELRRALEGAEAEKMR